MSARILAFVAVAAAAGAFTLFGREHPLPATVLLVLSIGIGIGATEQTKDNLRESADPTPPADPGMAPRWLRVLARPTVLTTAALFVVGATVYPALPDTLLRHSGGACWSKAVSALVVPAAGVICAVFAGLASYRPRPLRVGGWPTSRWLDLAAYLLAFVSLFGLVPAALGHRCG